MIEFLRDHAVGEGDARESFAKGQVVEDRTPESEVHFVRRGHAAFRDPKTGELTDHEGQPVARDEGAAAGDGAPEEARSARTPPRAASRRTRATSGA